MDKVYRLLPWLSLDQAVDWLQRLTSTAITREILLSLCEAGRSEIYINVGAGCTGVDDQSWILDVTASGYHRVTNPTVLCSTPPATSSLVLFGPVMWFEEDSSICRKEIDWFSSGLSGELCLVFKNAHVVALADMINAEELAAKDREVRAHQEAAERHRVEKEAAQLALHEAQADNSELRDLIANLRQSDVDRETEKPKKSAYLAIAGLLDLLLDHDRPRYTQASAVAAISEKCWTAAGETTLNHLFADAKKVARDAEISAQAKADTRKLGTAIQQS